MRLEFGHAVAAACRDEEGLIKRNALVELGRDRQQLVLLGQIDLVEDEEFLLGTPLDPLQHALGAFAEFGRGVDHHEDRSAEHTSELQSLMRISYAVFCLKTKK